MDKRDQILAKLALALQLVDNAGFQRALQLTARMPQVSFDQVLLQSGLIDRAAHQRLVHAFRQRMAQQGGAAAPPPRPAPRAGFDARARGLSDSDVLPALGAEPPTRPAPAGYSGAPAEERLVRSRPPVDLGRRGYRTEKVTIPDVDDPPPPEGHQTDVLDVPDDDSGEGLLLPDDDIYAQPTLVLQDSDDPDPQPMILEVDSGDDLEVPTFDEDDEEAILAQPTMVLRDEDDDVYAQPTTVLEESGELQLVEDTDEIYAQPTTVLSEEEEEDIFAQPTMVLDDEGAPSPGLGLDDPTTILKESGELELDLRLAQDVEPKKKRGGIPMPGAKSRKGSGPLTRKEFQRRFKIRLGFEGFTVGDYKILGEIARGAFGVVLEVEASGVTARLGKDRGYEGKLALKVALENTSDPRETERFLQETRVQISFVHPHIVQIFDSGVEAGLTYYSMELIRGMETRAHVLKHGPMPPLLAVRIAKEIASALSYVHKRRIYHRDLKPQNVLLDQDSKPYRAVLIDFGLVTEHESNQDKGLILGTPSYMPPEQAQPRGNHGPINATSDVYSLGATLFFLLTGQAPFTGRDPRKIIKEVIAKPPPDPLDLNPDIPRKIADVTLKCLEKRQRDRYHSAAQLQADLEKLLGRGRMAIKAKSLLGKFLGKKK